MPGCILAHLETNMSSEAAIVVRLLIAGVVLITWLLFAALGGKLGRGPKIIGTLAVLAFGAWLLFTDEPEDRVRASDAAIEPVAPPTLQSDSAQASLFDTVRAMSRERQQVWASRELSRVLEQSDQGAIGDCAVRTVQIVGVVAAEPASAFASSFVARVNCRESRWTVAVSSNRTAAVVSQCDLASANAPPCP